MVSLVVCGAPLAQRAGDLVAALADGGWTVRLIGTPAARSWVGDGVVPQFDFRDPRTPKPADPDAVVVCPATFNTLNKVAAGIADNQATASICETLGARTPTLFVPVVNQKLWNHPAFQPSVATLRAAGATFLNVDTGELTPVTRAAGNG